MKKYLVVACGVAMLWSAGRVTACDLCGCYNALEAPVARRGLVLGVAEQYTHYGTLQEDGHAVPNEMGERLDSSITQFLVGWQFHERVGVQLTVPYIHRSFRRTVEHDLAPGTEAGLGDVTLLAQVRVVDWVQAERELRLSLFGGVKFPTGSSARLHEETEEHHHEEEEHEHPSGVHGHDLALGSGSVDGIGGGAASARWRRLFATANVQYAIRTTGSFGYRYANDLQWSGGPGIYLVRSRDATLGLQFNISGEYKGKDTFGGMPAADTAVTMVYLGPEVQLDWKRLHADVGVDLPVARDNSALQVVPDLRVRAAVTWRF